LKLGSEYTWLSGLSYSFYKHCWYFWDWHCSNWI